MKKRSLWTKILAGILLLCILAGVVGFAVLRSTDIPKLYLTGNISGMEQKSDVRAVSFRYRDGREEIEGFAKIKVQGTSSLAYEKKNYTLVFYEDAALENKMAIDVGWGAQSEYCMKANWIDRTHSRNIVSARLAAKMQAKYDLLPQAPNRGLIDGFPVEIYSNGRFLGLYTFNIPKAEWLFGMDKDNPDHIVICGEGWDSANQFEALPDFETWAVEVGEENDETLEKMNRLFDFFINSSDEEFKRDFEQYMNLDAALNYYVMADLGYMADNLGKNILLATYDGKVWYLSLYDLDSTWGAEADGLALMEYEAAPLNMQQSNLFRRIERAFPQELAERYFELRSDILSNENIMAEFYAFEAEIPELSFRKEFWRWGQGPIRRRDELPGYEYDQIEAYLSLVSPRLDAKYAAWLE